MMVGKLLSYWEGNFSGAMLNFERVNHKFEAVIWANLQAINPFQEIKNIH